jgi:hypothetical protein
MTEFDWLRAAEGQPDPSTEGGESGYLSSPSDHLDPHLFDGMGLKSDVAYKILKLLLDFLDDELMLRGARNWVKAWLTGSGVTYQWDAGRGNGDLDVMVGIDRVKFNQANPGHELDGDGELASWLDSAMKSHLWPKTAHTEFNGQTYELTYFYNAGTGDDVKRIHPYAAIDVWSGRWIVKPPQLPADPDKLYPRDWYGRAHQDSLRAQSLVKHYHENINNLRAARPGTPGHINAGAMLNLVTTQARALLDDIHHGRANAFTNAGKGYTDEHNFRWQMAKASGTIKGLSEISGIRDRAHDLSETQLYGSPIKAADELVRRATDRYRGASS